MTPDLQALCLKSSLCNSTEIYFAKQNIFTEEDIKKELSGKDFKLTFPLLSLQLTYILHC